LINMLEHPQLQLAQARVLAELRGQMIAELRLAHRGASETETSSRATRARPRYRGLPQHRERHVHAGGHAGEV